MTAAGFALMVIAILAAGFDERIRPIPEWLKPLFGLFFVLGAMLLLVGVALFLWMAMP